MKKVAIYCRQSLKKEDSLSISKQEEDCRNCLSPEEKELVAIYKDQKSGKNMDREGFTEMMKEIKADKISKVVVWKLDRISRNLNDFCEMYSTFEEHETAFRSVNDNFDTSNAMGECMLKIAMMFAEMERKNTQMRVADNFYNRIKADGRWACGIAPYGFKNAKIDRISTLIPEKDELEAVKICFDKYANSPNCSLGQLARWLMDNGYKSRRTNNSWDSVSVMRMLKSPVYTVADELLKSYFVVKGITVLNEDKWTGETSCQVVGRTQTILKDGKEQRGKVEASKQTVYPTNFSGIVDSKTFIMVQGRLEQNQQFKRANAPSVLRELSGLLKCADCGYAIKANSVSKKDGRPFLCCHGRSTLKVCKASFKNVRFEDIQKSVGREVQKRLNDVAREVLENLEGKKKNDDKILDLNNKIENLLSLVELGGESAKRASVRIEELQGEIKQIQLDDFMATKTTERLRIPDSLPLVYNRMNEEKKKSICQQLIEKVLVSHNGDIEIVWKE